MIHQYQFWTILSNQPEVNINRLPAHERSCPICYSPFCSLEDDAKGLKSQVAEEELAITFECAKQMPCCGQAIGRDCLTHYISPNPAAVNSCPLCHFKWTTERETREDGMTDMEIAFVTALTSESSIRNMDCKEGSWIVLPPCAAIPDYEDGEILDDTGDLSEDSEREGSIRNIDSKEGPWIVLPRCAAIPELEEGEILDGTGDLSEDSERESLELLDASMRRYEEELERELLRTSTGHSGMK